MKKKAQALSRKLGLKVVRDTPLAPAAERTAIRTPSDVAKLLGPDAAGELVEVFWLLLLDSQSRVIAPVELTRGLLNSTLVAPREVFGLAIVARAAGIIVVHNHPSGDVTPSAEDRAVTRQLVEAGRLLDLPVYDHVILSADGTSYLSFAEKGWL